MNSKDTIKLLIALAAIGAAVALFVTRTQSEVDDDESVSHWYCTKTDKPFELHGDDNAELVRMVRRPVGVSQGGEEGPQAASLQLVTVAFSPFTKDWTGVPALKCGGCGEIYPTNPDSKKENLCPKCQWNPATGKVGPSEPVSSEGESSAP